MYEALLKSTPEYQKIAASLASPGPAALFGLPPAGRALLYASLQFEPLCQRPCPLRRFAPALPKGEPLIHPLYLLCARPSLPSMMSLAAASRSGRRSARALASSGGNLPSTQSARS